MAGVDNALSTYLMNGSVCGMYSKVGTYKLGEPSFKADCILMFEGDDSNTGAYNDGAMIPMPLDASRRHVNGCVVLRIGGSTDFVKYSTLISG
jgi:hypothetical protein